MHFYFVYVHPYFGINGRSARTVSLWYLLNKSCYPYTIFNREICFHEKAYEETILKSQRAYNLNYFISYILETLSLELSNEIKIQKIISTLN